MPSRRHRTIRGGAAGQHVLNTSGSSRRTTAEAMAFRRIVKACGSSPRGELDAVARHGSRGDASSPSRRFQQSSRFQTARAWRKCHGCVLADRHHVERGIRLDCQQVRAAGNEPSILDVTTVQRAIWFGVHLLLNVDSHRDLCSVVPVFTNGRQRGSACRSEHQEDGQHCASEPHPRYLEEVFDQIKAAPASSHRPTIGAPTWRASVAYVDPVRRTSSVERAQARFTGRARVPPHRVPSSDDAPDDDPGSPSARRSPDH